MNKMMTKIETIMNKIVIFSLIIILTVCILPINNLISVHAEEDYNEIYDSSGPSPLGNDAELTRPGFVPEHPKNDDISYYNKRMKKIYKKANKHEKKIIKQFEKNIDELVDKFLNHKLTEKNITKFQKKIQCLESITNKSRQIDKLELFIEKYFYFKTQILQYDYRLQDFFSTDDPSLANDSHENSLITIDYISESVTINPDMKVPDWAIDKYLKKDLYSIDKTIDKKYELNKIIDYKFPGADDDKKRICDNDYGCWSYPKGVKTYSDLFNYKYSIQLTVHPEVLKKDYNILKERKNSMNKILKMMDVEVQTLLDNDKNAYLLQSSNEEIREDYKKYLYLRAFEELYDRFKKNFNCNKDELFEVLCYIYGIKQREYISKIDYTHYFRWYKVELFDHTVDFHSSFFGSPFIDEPEFFKEQHVDDKYISPDDINDILDNLDY